MRRAVCNVQLGQEIVKLYNGDKNTSMILEDTDGQDYPLLHVQVGWATCHVAPSGEGKGTTSTCIATQEGRAHLPKCNEEHLVVRVLPSKHREIWVGPTGYCLISLLGGGGRWTAAAQCLRKILPRWPLCKHLETSMKSSIISNILS